MSIGLLCALALKENHLLYEWLAYGYTVKKFWIFSKGLVLAEKLCIVTKLILLIQNNKLL